MASVIVLCTLNNEHNTQRYQDICCLVLSIYMIPKLHIHMLGVLSKRNRAE